LGLGPVSCVFQESIRPDHLEVTITAQSQSPHEDFQTNCLHSWRIDFMDGFVNNDVLWVGDFSLSTLDDFMIQSIELLDYLLDKAVMAYGTPPFVFDSRLLPQGHLHGHPQHRQFQTLSKRFKTRRDVAAASLSQPPTPELPSEPQWVDPTLPPLVGRQYHPILSAGRRLCVHIFASPIDDHDAPGGLPLRTRCGLHDIAELFTEKTSHFNGLEWHHLDAELRPDIRADLEVGLRDSLQSGLGRDPPSDLHSDPYIVAFRPQYYPDVYRQNAVPIVAAATCNLVQDLALAFLATEHACHEARKYDLLPWLVQLSPLPWGAQQHQVTIHTENELD